MIQRMLASALFAGFAAGLLAALLHFAFVQKLILLAEQYETGALVHFQGVVPADSLASHSVDATAATESVAPADDTQMTEAVGHDQEADETSALERNGFTALFYGLTYVGYALLMVAGFALAEQFGRKVEVRQGLFWGLAGFAALQLAPAMGLAPELPGTVAADLAARQLWWAGTVLATMAGLGALAFGRGSVRWVFAIALLAAPHLIGAPHPEGFSGITPPELASEFAAHSLGVALIAWLALGVFATRLWVGKTT